MKLKQYALAIAAVAGSLLGLNASAQSFSYNNGDLLLGFRSTSSTSNLVVDLGSASALLYGHQAGDTVTITAFTASQLTSTFGSLNNLYFSVFGDINNNSSSLPLNTLWLSTPRSDVNTQTSPVNSLSSTGQGNIRSYLDAVAAGASATTLGAIALSSTVVIEPGSMNTPGTISYLKGIANQNNTGISGNIHGTWNGFPVEGLTTATFGTDTTPLVLDLYQQNPGTANVGQFQGTFTLDNSGVLTFTAVPEPSTFAMFGSGLLALAAIRRFKK